MTIKIDMSMRLIGVVKKAIPKELELHGLGSHFEIRGVFQEDKIRKIIEKIDGVKTIN